jgi:hypothetical protein
MIRLPVLTVPSEGLTHCAVPLAFSMSETTGEDAGPRDAREGSVESVGCQHFISAVHAT